MDTVSISRLLSVYKASEVDDLLRECSGKTLNEPNLKQSDIESQWKFLGNNPSNGSSVNILGNGEKGLIERITNAIDSVIEKKVNSLNLGSPTSSSRVISNAFPAYYDNCQKILEGKSTHSLAKDAEDQVVLAANDSSRSSRPTFDVVDRGTGIDGSEFPNTILSLNHGNKLKRDQQYLIGAFGQGGSTSLPFTYATIIISKYNGKLFWTVIKQVDLQDYKNSCFVYLEIGGRIPEAEIDELDDESPDYLKAFVNQESGTMVRMVETEISPEYRKNEITKPRTLSDYINTQLFNVGLPIDLIDNRKNFQDNAHTQDRNAYGTFMKLRTWKKYVHDEYSGTMKVLINNQAYNVDYYVILPAKEDDWGNDHEAEKAMEQFNVTGDPVIYTVNGQTITTESFTKIKNAGLNFLRNRLLVVINLDVLGVEKYKFFTSDRARIKDTEKTKGFFDQVVKALSEVEKLKEINSIIADKSINESVDTDTVNEIANDVKSNYNKYLKGGASLKVNPKTPPDRIIPDEDYLDHIKSLTLNMSKTTFYIDQIINVVLKTGAQKYVNQAANIYFFVDDKSFYSATPAYMNGRIQYSFAATATGFGVGKHVIKFSLFDQKRNVFSIESNEVAIEILNEKAPITERIQKDKVLDLKINIVKEATLICDVAKNTEDKTIQANLCLDSDELRAEVYGLAASDDEVKSLQMKIIKPIVLFALFQGEQYDNLPSDEDKNRLIISLIKSIGAVME